MEPKLNSILFIVGTLLLAYVAFLKPQNGRFAPDANPNSKYEGFVVLDTQTGVLCNAVGGEIKVIPFPLCSEILRDVFLVISW